MDEYRFDLQRIFFGDLPPLFFVEIALRTSIMLLYMMLLLRLMGKRSQSQFFVLEFVLIIALGSAVGDPMFYPEIPVLHGLVVITVVALLQRLLVWLTNRSKRLEALLEGSPLLVIREGHFDLEGLKRCGLSRYEIYMELRLAGVEQMGQVKRSYMELNGEMSIFLFEDEQVRPGLPLMPELELDEADALMTGTPASEAGGYACLHCGEVITLKAREALPNCPDCQEQMWLKADYTRVAK